MNGVESLLRIYDYIRPVLDVGVLFFLLYKGYQLIVRTNSAQILKAAVIIALAYAVVGIFDLTTVKWLLTFVTPALLVGFVLVFQPEIRKILLKLGQAEWFNSRKKTLYSSDTIQNVLLAADTLSKQKRGMLVVFLRKTKLENISDTGEKLDAKISASLLVTIFVFDTPLHDGACVIQDDRVVAAGCFLPLSEQYDIKKTYGTRHRAALGTSEVSDSVVLVVSEETGAISLAYDSVLHYDLSMSQLTTDLTRLLSVKTEKSSSEDGGAEDEDQAAS
ncbi:MAG: diadenylate cyclase CdaA [Treponema sp.]|nr:diadenylate cyclase CdaA [Treponema sp.]MBR7080627.1 diadenylate cyclase CdaA [Treponema sp.]